MDQTTVGDFFKKGDKVRLLRDYPEFKRGRKGTFIQYSGNGFAIIQFGEVHASIWPNDLEKVQVRVQPQFQRGEVFRLKRKWGTYKKGYHGTFMNYGPKPREVTVRLHVNVPLQQIPITYLEKREEA